MNLQAIKKILIIMKEIVWPLGYSTTYNSMRLGTLVVGALSFILDLVIANLFGQGQGALASLLTVVSVIITLICGFTWTWILEQMSMEKVNYGKRISKKIK
jgi:hypothetical protein